MWYDKLQELLRRYVRHFDGQMAADTESAIDALKQSFALHAAYLCFHFPSD